MSLPFQKKHAQNCSEKELKALAVEFSETLRPGARVFLEGPLGVGKTRFAEFLCKAIGMQEEWKGSPTFSIANEYTSAFGPVIHIDLYRLNTETEIEEAGLHFYDREKKGLIIIEWLSLFPAFKDSIQKESAQVFQVNLSFECQKKQDLRRVEVNKLKPPSCS